MPPELIPSDSDYASEEDSDFAPDTVPAAIESSDEESEAEEPAKVDGEKGAGKKRKRVDDEAHDLGFENSGDEAVIKEFGKPKRRKGKKGRVVEDQEEDGEGDVVRTRSMRALEKVSKKRALLDTSTATIDVDAVWQAMLAGKPLNHPVSEPIPATEATPLISPLSPSSKRSQLLPHEPRKDFRSPGTLGDGPDSMIMIKRTYTFAGKLHTEQKLVPKNSAEAKLYLSSLPSSPPPPPISTSPKKRPAKKARRSIFEPVPPDGFPKRNDLHFGERAKGSGVQLSVLGKGEGRKLNTVEKSAMDWAGFVDKEGIKDELDAAGKSKRAFKAKQEFLARVERKKEADERRARGLPALGEFEDGL